MDSVLVISDEPALAETLESELPGIRIEQARFSQAAAKLHDDGQRLVLIDESDDAGSLPEAWKASALRLTRPVSLSELLYTIRERLQGKSAPGREELELAPGFRLSPSERLLHPDDAPPIALTEKEMELLQCLLEENGEPIARDMLLKKVWGYSDEIATHTLETHIYRLRGKLRQASESLDILSSEEGGYRLKR